jgi:DNA repair exonuclease SbcCD ATPase subunit
MSVEFSNAYQEILFDNLVAIIKQNFVFQTQIKLAENSSKINEDLKNQLDELTVAYNNSKSELNQMNVYKTKAESNTSAHEEKNRIQAALNDELKKSSILQKELVDKSNEIDRIAREKEKQIKSLSDSKDKELQEVKNKIDDLMNYIQKLEEVVPVTKLKKLKIEQPNSTEKKEQVILSMFEEKNDTPKIDNKIQKVLDGNTF